jgi:hypothetical protein
MNSMTRLLTIICCIALIGGCAKDNEKAITGKLKSHSECREYITHNPLFHTPENLSCVEYSFDAATRKLILLHYNAGFNCCPGVISCNISVENKVITITETESAKDCRCTCLYDLEYEIERLSAGKYMLVFIEPYVKDDNTLEVSLDLAAKPSGTACVSRTMYPWNNE